MLGIIERFRIARKMSEDGWSQTYLGIGGFIQETVGVLVTHPLFSDLVFETTLDRWGREWYRVRSG